MLSGANLPHCIYFCFVLLLIRPYTTVYQIMFILSCSFTYVAQIDIKMLIISYLLLLNTFSKAFGEERNSKNIIIYPQTQTESETNRHEQKQTKTDLEIDNHKYRHTRTHMDSNLGQNQTRTYYVTSLLGQRQTQQITDRNERQNKYIIRTQTNTGRHNVYELITHDITKLCIAVHKQHDDSTI